MSKEMVGGCCVCSDERGWPDNPLVYCDGIGCSVAVHQACYGIVTVPTGPWYCRKCESPDNKGKARCELCPGRSGALKHTDTGGWAHVVCALYIPEVRFASVTSMEPIVLGLIPPERFNKKCYICEESGKPLKAAVGACMQCNKPGCKQQFHVTCAQSQGLLCEEAGNYLDNVKYCGYCYHHYSRLKRCGNVKTVPPYKPVTEESYSSDSTGGDEVEPSGSNDAQPQQAKSKGPGRKRSRSSGSAKPTVASGKALPPPTTDATEDPEPPVTRKQKNSDKHKKKSPARSNSSTGEASGSKNNTPAPSPQHAAESPVAAKGTPTPAPGGKTPSSEAPPPPKAAEPVTVISSVAPTPAAAPAPATNTIVNLSPPSQSSVPQQESVIFNAASMVTKQTKKRKAAQAAAAQAAADAAAALARAAPKFPANSASTEVAPPQQTWDKREDIQEPAMKLRRAKPETEAPMAHYANIANISLPPPLPSQLPPPPPAHSPSAPINRHLHSPVAGPSGTSMPAPNIPSPSAAHQNARAERDALASLLISMPLPTTSYGGGINLSMHRQVSHEPGVSGHPGQPMHAHPSRSAWGGLNVQYEQQQPGSSGMSGGHKQDMSMGLNMGQMQPTSMRAKKRAAIAASVASQQPMPMTSMHMPGMSSQGLNLRRGPQPTQPIYTETIRDSPPASPGGAKKNELLSYRGPHVAPHMLGNELNPESMVADRLQEQLTAEMAAHEASVAGADPLVPPPLINKAGNRPLGAQSLDQLLERHWEQGSQFLMEQAQHFDIASLLSCLHQLRTENARLEDNVDNLQHRRDHLLAVNARLAIPLISSMPSPEPTRWPRENGGLMRPPRTDIVPSVHHHHHHSMVDQRQHPSMQDPRSLQRPNERADDRSGLRVPESVVHMGSHPQRPLNLEAQMSMRDIQQKPS